LEGSSATLISLLFYDLIIFFLITGKIKIFAALAIIQYSFYSFIVGLILLFKLAQKPEYNRISEGHDIPYIPLIIGIILFVLAILCFFISKLSSRPPNRLPRLRWFWLILAEVILITGLALALFAIYVPKFIIYERVSYPSLSCLLWLPFVTMSSLIFYKASRMNTDVYPNLMRYVVFLFNFAQPFYSVILALIFIYAVPGKISYAFWAAIITIGLLPPSLVIVGLARDHIPVRLFGTSSPTPDIAKGSEG